MRYDDACDSLDKWKSALDALIERQIELKRAIVRLRFAEARETECRTECEKIMGRRDNELLPHPAPGTCEGVHRRAVHDGRSK